MDKNEKVSIVVPIYNVEMYLEKCIESLINQTYDNIEIILVDDGSTDNSHNICKNYAQKDNRIKLIHKENGGLSDARNVGIENATGKYITFVDSDDWLSYDYCEIMVKHMNEENVDIVMAKLVSVYNDDYVFVHKSNYNKNVYTNLEALEKFEDTVNVVAVAKLYKKELFNNLRYKVGKIHEDEFMFHKIFFEAKNVLALDSALYAYRQRENSITTAKYSLKRLDALEALEDRMIFYDENKLYELKEKTRAVYMYFLKKNIKEIVGNDIDDKEKYIENLMNKLKDNYKVCKKTKYISLRFYIFSKLSMFSDKIFRWYIYK